MVRYGNQRFWFLGSFFILVPITEIAMATSSITVVSNTNRLRKIDLRPNYPHTSLEKEIPLKSGLGEQLLTEQA